MRSLMESAIATETGRRPAMARVAGGPAAPTAKATETKWRRPGSGVLCLVLLGLTAGALGHVAVQARRLEVARALAVEQSAHRELVDRRRHVQIELSRLKGRSYVEAIAREKLKMDLPATTDIRRVKANGEVEVAPPPIPAPLTGAASAEMKATTKGAPAARADVTTKVTPPARAGVTTKGAPAAKAERSPSAVPAEGAP